MATVARDEVLNLMTKKDLIEAEIRDMGALLAKNGIGMSEPLVDPEGFPLAHIDIYEVRYARNRIICLQNNLKAVMKEIENGLGTYYASCDKTPTTTSVSSSHRDSVKLEPFAKVSNVAPGSPADEAGLQDDDCIVQFGSINVENFRDMNTIAELVRHSENVEVFVRVRRGIRVVAVTLRPHRWTGRGLLGCLMTPVEAVDR